MPVEYFSPPATTLHEKTTTKASNNTQINPLTTEKRLNKRNKLATSTKKKEAVKQLKLKETFKTAQLQRRRRSGRQRFFSFNFQ
jgi:hypothetical protein